MKHSLPRLDIMVAYSCNLACQGCISLSDRRRSGVEPAANIELWIKQWKNWVDPDVITVFGGEPCLHPDLVSVCQSIRRAWPESTLRLITNGMLLDRFPAQSWFDLAPLEIQVSVHREDLLPKINRNIKLILQQRHPWSVSRQGGPGQHQQITWSHPDGISIYKSLFGEFVVPYHEQDNRILPWNSDPVKAHSICGAPNTPILYKGRLYKCPAVANVADLTGETWFGYQGLLPSQDLKEFINNIGRPESCCGQCPEPDQARVINHMDQNSVRIKNHH